MFNDKNLFRGDSSSKNLLWFLLNKKAAYRFTEANSFVLHLTFKTPRYQSKLLNLINAQRYNK